MNKLLVWFLFPLLLSYVIVELGWGGPGTDCSKNPPSKRPAFPRWRPWRPSEPKPRGPDPVPSPKPRLPEGVNS
jgi:hypothetical protein